MKEQERKDRASLPPCPNPTCQESHVVRNGSHQGRQRSHCRSCKTYFGQTQATPMYGLKTPAAEVAQALLILMRRGSLRAAEELTGHNYETSSGWLKRAATQAAAITQVLASDLHLCTCCGGVVRIASLPGLELTRMACALAVAGKIKDMHSASGKAMKNKRRIVFECKRDRILVFQSFCAGLE